MDNGESNTGSAARPDQILQSVARSLEAALLRTNTYDVNARRLSPTLSGSAARTSPLTRRTKTKLRSHAVELESNDEFVKTSILGRFPEELISINRPDRIMLTQETSLTITENRFHVYASDSKLLSADSAVLRSAEAQKLVASIISGRNESIHFYVNKVVCYLFEPPSPDRVLQVLHDMISLAELLEIRHGKSETTALPAQFTELVHLAARWSIADDGEREDAIEAASEKDLEVLVASIKPRLGEIDAFLLDDAAPFEESAALGTLAECAVEAELEIARRKRK